MISISAKNSDDTLEATSVYVRLATSATVNTLQPGVRSSTRQRDRIEWNLKINQNLRQSAPALVFRSVLCNYFDAICTDRQVYVFESKNSHRGVRHIVTTQFTRSGSIVFEWPMWLTDFTLFKTTFIIKLKYLSQNNLWKNLILADTNLMIGQSATVDSCLTLMRSGVRPTSSWWWVPRDIARKCS